MSSSSERSLNGDQSDFQRFDSNDSNRPTSRNTNNNQTNGVHNIRDAADTLRDQMPSGNIILEEANLEGGLNPDVLFRGGFTQGFPNFSITIDRTNITPDGTVTGEPIFSFGNLPNYLRELVESTIRSSGPRRKRATDYAIKRLQVIDPRSLKESETTCSICYEAFEQLRDADDDTNDKQAVDLSAIFLASRDLIDDDPPILHPKDPSGVNFGEYHKMKKNSTMKDDNRKEPEHVPVQMPCGHVFGRSCLLEWLKSNISCPLCRREVEAQPAQPSEGFEVDGAVFDTRSTCPANWSENGNLFNDPQIPFPPPTGINFGSIFDR